MICPLSPMSSVSQYMPLSEKTDGPLVRKKGGQQGTGDKGERNMSDLGFTIVTIIAIIVGPISAVFITRLLDDRRARRDRRWEIFRTLMRYRLKAMHAEFVGALNLLEVEFHNDPPVIKGWKSLLETFSRPDLADQRANALVRLLDAIAKNLDVSIEQLDISSGAYSPQGWEIVEERQEAILAFASDIASGNTALPIIVQPSSPQER